MAPKGNKRAAAASVEEPRAKRAAEFLKKQGVTPASAKAVGDIVGHPLCDLPEECRKLLLAMLPWSLGVVSDDRSELQAKVVQMFQDTAAGVKDKLQAAVDAEAAILIDVDAKKTQLAAAVAGAEASAATSQSSVEEAREKVKEASTQLLARKSALAKTETEESSGNEGLKANQALKATIEGILAETEGLCEKSNLTATLDAVMVVAKGLSLEESMLLALPGSLVKKEREGFDQFVVHEFQSKLRQKVADIDKEAEVAAPVAEARASAVREAKLEFENATAAQQSAAAELSNVQSEAADASSKLEAAKKAVSDAEPGFAAATAKREEKQSDLDEFCDYYMAYLEMLCSRQSSKPQVAASPSAGSQA